MKDLLLSLSLMTLSCVYADVNDTMAPTGEPTLEPTPAVTSVYTSSVILSTQFALNDSNLSDPRVDDGCAFEWLATLDDGEGIVIDVCGFFNDAGDAMVDIEVMIPTDRWFGVAFADPADFDADDAMNNAYAVIIPQNSREISERLMGSGNAGERLISTVRVADDYTEMGMRTLRLQRDATVSLNDLSGDPLEFGDYYDFMSFSVCDAEMRVIYAFANLLNEAFEVDADWFESDNSGSRLAEVEEVQGIECAQEEGDGVERVSAVMVGGVVSAAVLAMMW